MNKRKRTILLATILVLLAAATAGYLLWNKPHKDVMDADAVKVTAAALYNSYITDSATARKRYTGKVLEVSGEISKLALNQQEQQIILIKTPVPGAFINCSMEKSSEILKEGGAVTVKGICSGYIGGDADMGLPGDVFLTRAYPIIK